ncbi:GntR family transcriptional regulator [Corynebacterium sp.]|uniref:GntR family transcriptional regulator n=1 Tax=Corynebacterium sp. TaxID=1720 RepID=UPI0026DAF461|nr:GntR family transcriptional regulator [Corynebacterium sp.]MDO5032693.1 GntR family transcriptional regulator [Corynebacterium sp.]
MTTKDKLSKAQRIAEQLRQHILTGAIRPTEVILEGEVAEEFGCSKTPAREALQQLCREGLITVMPKKGYHVRPMTAQDLSFIMDMRMLLEPHAAAEAARLATERDIAAMQAWLDEQRADPPVYPSLGKTNSAKEFHAAILDCCANTRLRQAITDLHAEMVRAHHVIPELRTLVEQPEELAEHEAILTAIRSHDQQAAAAAMRTHLRTIYDSMAGVFNASSILWQDSST